MTRPAKIPHVSWNQNQQIFIGRYKDIDGKWQAKQFGKAEFPRKHEALCNAAFLDFLRGKGLLPGAAPAAVKTVEEKNDLTLAFLAPKWLQHIEDNPKACRAGTLRGYRTSVNNYILDHSEYKHFSIQNLGVQTQLTVQDMRLWFQSLTRLGLSDSSQSGHINCLRRIFKDSVAEGWLPEDFISPFDRAAVRQTLSEFQRGAEAARRRAPKIFFPEEMIEPFFTKPLRSKRYGAIGDERRVRYLLHYLTGMRDMESSALLWSDIHLDSAIPYVHVERQLERNGFGGMPFVMVDEQIHKGKTREEIDSLPNAKASEPKYGSVRSIPLHPFLVSVLRWWNKTGWQKHTGEMVREELPVLPRGLGWKGLAPGETPFDAIEPDSADLIRKDLARLELPQAQHGKSYTFHALRRTFSTLLRSRGVSAADVAWLLGHGAGTAEARTAEGHYIGEGVETLRAKLRLILLLPIPSRLTVSNGEISAHTSEKAA